MVGQYQWEICAGERGGACDPDGGGGERGGGGGWVYGDEGKGGRGVE